MDDPDYDPGVATQPLTDAELQALDALLASLPADDAMNVEALDGYLTALLLGPRLVATLPSSRWLPPVWGGAGDGSAPHAPFASGKQRKRAAVLVLRHLRAVDTALAGPPEAWEPVFSIAGDAADGTERVDAEDWCIGFLLGAALAADAWAPFWDDALMAPLVRLGADEAPLDDAERDAVSRSVADAVATMVAMSRPPKDRA